MTQKARLALRKRACVRLETLSPAERVVFDHLLDGGDAYAIAARIKSSRSTIRNQLIAIYRKMEVCSRLELLATFVLPPPKETS